MAELERALSELRVEWPPTPDIAGAVRTAIAPQPARPARRRFAALRPPRRGMAAGLAYAAALLLVALGATIAVSEPARSAILEFLGLKNAKIERREPEAPPAPTTRAPLGADLGLGRAVTLEQAAAVAGFEPVAPAELGAPGAVYVDAQLGVSLVYAPTEEFPESAQTGTGLLITQLLGQVTPYIGKAAGAGTVVERLSIDGDTAYLLSGDPHGFAYEAYQADTRFEDQRLAGNTLLVEHGDLLLRIEGETSKRRAIEIARSVTATFEP